MEVNEMILAVSDVTPEHREDKLEVPDGTALPDNMGTLILDATCSPSNIRYPQDFSLLNEAREHLEGMIDYFNDTYHPWDKPRTYREIARKDYLKLAKSKRRSAKAVRMQIRRELFNLARDMRYIEQYLAVGYELPDKYRSCTRPFRSCMSSRSTCMTTRHIESSIGLSTCVSPICGPLYAARSRHR